MNSRRVKLLNRENTFFFFFKKTEVYILTTCDNLKKNFLIMNKPGGVGSQQDERSGCSLTTTNGSVLIKTCRYH